MNGIIIINKPKSCTSHDIVRNAKRILNEKVGHTGTLDPNATGVLPLLIGKGTEISKYIINHDKTYEAELQLGEKTDTADSEGQVVETKAVSDEMLEEKIKQVLENLIGSQEQIPPLYSAIKVKGKKLYEYARNGENVEIKPRKIEIYDMKLISINQEEKIIKFQVKCSKGTYIRTLSESVAENLGTVGYMKELKRMQVGDFDLKDAITMEELEKNASKYIITIEKYFEELPKLNLSEHKKTLFLNGVRLSYDLEDGIYKIYEKEKFIGIGIIKGKLLKRDIIL